MAQVPDSDVTTTSVGGSAYTVPFAYQNRAEVFVEVNGTPVAFTWVNDGNISITPAPAAGAVVRRYRSTSALQIRHDYRNGVPFTPKNIAENNDQLLFVVQEATASADAALTVASSVISAAQAAAEDAAAADASANASAASAAASAASAATATTTANSALVLIDDALQDSALYLRNDLANSTDPAKGAALVGFNRYVAASVGKALGSLHLSVTTSDLWPAQPGAAINATIAACEAAGGGVVMIPEGQFTLETTVNLTPRVVLRGSGKNSTVIRWDSTGVALVFAPSVFSPGPHAIEDMSISSSNSVPVAGSCGIQVSDTYGFGIRRVAFSGLNTDIRLLNHNFWTEGTVIDDVNSYNCDNGLTFARSPEPATGTDSFAYTTIKNYASEPLASGFCMVIGDDAISTRSIQVYNAVIFASLWHKDGAAAIKWGANATVTNSAGHVRSEGFTGAANLQPGLSGANNGLRQFCGEWVTNDGGRTTSDQHLKRMDFRAVKFRDLGQSGPGAFQSAGKWFKCINLTLAKGSISGSIRATGAYGSTRSWGGNAEFCFGRGGATQKPAFSVSGDAFSGKGGGSVRVVWARDDATGDEAMYFWRPAFCNLALFTYAYDSYLNGRPGNASPPEGIGLQELWEESTSPISMAGTTILFDSLNVYQTQNMYVGPEMVFTGQRTVLSFNGDGSTKNFYFTHGLGAAPAYYSAVALSIDACNAVIQEVVGGTGDVVVKFKTAPITGTGNVKIAVEAGINSWTRLGRPST